MDTWSGSLSKPVTLNKYLYADGNPVMGVDPSGNMTIMEAMTSIYVQEILAETAIPMPNTCYNCSGVSPDGFQLRLSPYLAAQDAENYTLSTHHNSVRKMEMLSEIYMPNPNKKCYSFRKPYSGDGYSHGEYGWVNKALLSQNPSKNIVGYWHNHVQPAPDEDILRYGGEIKIKGAEYPILYLGFSEWDRYVAKYIANLYSPDKKGFAFMTHLDYSNFISFKYPMLSYSTY